MDFKAHNFIVAKNFSYFFLKKRYNIEDEIHLILNCTSNNTLPLVKVLHVCAIKTSKSGQWLMNVKCS